MSVEIKVEEQLALGITSKQMVAVLVTVVGGRVVKPTEMEVDTEFVVITLVPNWVSVGTVAQDDMTRSWMEGEIKIVCCFSCNSRFEVLRRCV